MSEFFDVVTPKEAINKLLSEKNFPEMISEKINTVDSNGRILNQDIKSEVNILYTHTNNKIMAIKNWKLSVSIEAFKPPYKV